MSNKRLSPQKNEWIDRSSEITFNFEGKKITGYKGDVITSALVASGHSLLGRSFKYHRPRGFLSFANHDANILLETKNATNIRADVTQPREEENYKVVNTFGKLKFDCARVIEGLSPFLPVGFYYKAFYSPRFLFPYWEKLIRRLAGLGKVKVSYDQSRFPIRRVFCDVLVVGAGPSGLAAATSLCSSDYKIIIADENSQLGGSYNFTANSDSPEQQKVIELMNYIRGSSVQIFESHFAAGFYDDKTIPLIGEWGIVLVHANSVILATGAYEQPAIFRNNDLPGIVLSSAISRMVHRYSVNPFSAPVILAGNRNAYEVAINLASKGINITRILDLEDPDRRGDIAAEAEQYGIKIVSNVEQLSAIGKGNRLNGIKYTTGASKKENTIITDGLLMSVGWNPAINLLKQAGGRVSYSNTIGQLAIDRHPEGVFSAGKIRGIYSLVDRINDGELAADACLRFLQGSSSPFEPIKTNETENHPYPIISHKSGKEFVDLDEDLTIKDVKTSIAEGFDSVELLKRYSTIGMGPSQGKMSSINGNRILARVLGLPIATVGLTTPRPFVHPVPIGHLAGQRIRKQKRTPLDNYHRNRQADMKEAGAWVRPMSYLINSPQEQIGDEYDAVRNKVGLIDVSTLGKIEIFGADAKQLMEYAYTCNFDKLHIGMTRYIFMVDAGGTLIDDGVAAKLSDHHYYLTTTTTHASSVLAQLHLFARQLNLEVEILDRTGSIGAINLAGPLSKKVLSSVTEIDLNKEKFPYLGFRRGFLNGTEVRFLRVGFVGELGYEIHIPSHSLAKTWDEIMRAGKQFGIRTFGVEAQRLLRLEKGHLIFGQDTDGNTNPYEVGLGWGVNLRKARFHGKHSLIRLKELTRRSLVGFRCESGTFPAILENNLAIEGSEILGRVTSVGHSPTAETTLGLLMLNDPREIGESISIRDSKGQMIKAEVSATAFYDPKNERQNM